jgi:hypothetical protein
MQKATKKQHGKYTARPMKGRRKSAPAKNSAKNGSQVSTLSGM